MLNIYLFEYVSVNSYMGYKVNVRGKYEYTRVYIVRGVRDTCFDVI